jgi:hypothetical protein
VVQLLGENNEATYIAETYLNLAKYNTTNKVQENLKMEVK